MGWSQYKAGLVKNGLKDMIEAIEQEGHDSPESLGKIGEILMREGPDQDLKQSQLYL